jgi:hypothetical protein
MTVSSATILRPPRLEFNEKAGKLNNEPRYIRIGTEVQSVRKGSEIAARWKSAPSALASIPQNIGNIVLGALTPVLPKHSIPSHSHWWFGRLNGKWKQRRRGSSHLEDFDGHPANLSFALASDGSCRAPQSSQPFPTAFHCGSHRVV